MKKCPICSAEMKQVLSAILLHKHDVPYYRCDQCGLLQTQEPYWLGEAYNEAIAVADTGLVQRNIAISRKLAALIYFALDPKATYLDVAGGYGMLARLMRDMGFDFYWDDKYCTNILARGFEADQAKANFNALTAFEVLEHVHDPLAFISEAMNRFGSHKLIFSTELYGDDVPPKDWWYFMFNTGQHVTFYQKRTLEKMANRLELYLHSAHGIHMFTDEPINTVRFDLLTSRISYLVSFYVRRRMVSRIADDHKKLLNSVECQLGNNSQYTL